MEPAITDSLLEILLDDFISCHGYDFTGYSRASLRRRLNRLYLLDGAQDPELFRAKLCKDKPYFQYALSEISVNVTEMFRDPGFYKTLRETVLPELATQPFIRIWHAGCASGEEVYSMAILLDEAGLLHKSLLYGTDLNHHALDIAQKGIYPIAPLQQYSRNYQRSGGTKDFSSYFSANYNQVQFNESLTHKMVFSSHNLVSDASFNSFQLILCRNVLIYFDRQLQDRVLQLFDLSLDRMGFLALGTKESLRFSALDKTYQPVTEKEKIWRKIS